MLTRLIAVYNFRNSHSMVTQLISKFKENTSCRNYYCSSQQSFDAANKSNKLFNGVAAPRLAALAPLSSPGLNQKPMLIIQQAIVIYLKASLQ